MIDRLIPIKEAAKRLGVTMTTLRRWDAEEKLKSVRAGEKGHRYYRKKDLDLFIQDLPTIAWEWAIDEATQEPDSHYYCPDSSIFQSRLEKLRTDLMTIDDKNVELINSLIVLVAGEIGNNSFDHNLGNWPDVRGLFFGYDFKRRSIVLADRGIGILASLKRVRPLLITHKEALKVAFTERISGRAPESRGNGLKLVRKVVHENPSLTLDFRTGDARLILKEGDYDVNVETSDQFFRGCFASITF
ncbi:MAG: MerR family transcriptional regulator [Bacteroidetes bacterium]|nr:MerR family transcriptional regulator [Bacteroidota bacterium]